MMKLFIIVLSALSIAYLAHGSDMDNRWKSFKGKLGGKLFNPLKEGIYKEKFFAAMKDVEETNARYRKGESLYKKQINKYSHLPVDEWLKLRTGLQPEPEPTKPEKWTRKSLKGSVPPSIDWHKAGLTTSVKDQGTCGSCYSFAATGGLEGQAAKLNKTKIDLSNQQIVDCSGSFGNKGCKGGNLVTTLKYIIQSKGLPAWSSYPYTGTQGKCRKDTIKPLANFRSFKRFTYVEKDTLKEMLATTGPIPVTMKVLPSLNDYHGGLYFERQCALKLTIRDMNHAVLLVGYGVKDGHPYWKVKNSWGPTWGEAGYFYIPQDFDCGIKTDLVVPNV